MRRLLAVVLLTAGCSSMAPDRRTDPPVDRISFDRASFAFLVADVGQIFRQQCAAKKLDSATCIRVDEQYKELRRQITTPPPPSTTPAGIDTEQLMRLLGVLIGAAT